MPDWASRGGLHLYRLQLEGLFTRFFWSPDGLTWIVQMPDGETRELGFSRLIANDV
jgi:hypothetical protein